MPASQPVNAGADADRVQKELSVTSKLELEQLIPLTKYIKDIVDPIKTLRDDIKKTVTKKDVPIPLAAVPTPKPTNIYGFKPETPTPKIPTETPIQLADAIKSAIYGFAKEPKGTTTKPPIPAAPVVPPTTPPPVVPPVPKPTGIQAFTAALNDMTAKLNATPTILAKAGDAISGVLGKIGSLGTAIGGAGKAVGGLGTALLIKIPIPVAAVAAGIVKVATVAKDAAVGLLRLAETITGKLGQAASQAANNLQAPMRVLDAGIGAIGSTITRFVSHIDPGRMVRFQYALDSLYATIGKALLPALDAMMPVITAISQAISGAGEKGQRAISALAAATVGLTVFAAAATAITAVLSGGFLPIIAGVIGALGGMVLVSGKLQPILDTLSKTMAGVMDAVGDVMDAFSEALDSALPQIKEAITYGAKLLAVLASGVKSLAPAFKALVDVGMAVMKALQPVGELLTGILIVSMKALAKVIETIAPMMVNVANAIGKTINYIIDIVTKLAKKVGLDLGLSQFAPLEKEPKREEAPVRAAAFTDPLSVIREAQKAAYSLGKGADDPAKKTASNTQRIAEGIEKGNEIAEKQNGLLGHIKSSLDALETTGQRAGGGKATDSGIVTPRESVLNRDHSRAVSKTERVAGAVVSSTPAVAGSLWILRQLDRGK